MRQKELIEYLKRGWRLHTCEPTYEGDSWCCQLQAVSDGEEGKDGPDADGMDGIFITHRQAEALIAKGLKVEWRPNIYAIVWMWPAAKKTTA